MYTAADRSATPVPRGAGNKLSFLLQCMLFFEAHITWEMGGSPLWWVGSSVLWDPPVWVASLSSPSGGDD